MSLRIGSLCTGYGGLDMAVQATLGGELAWVSDIDPGAAKILAHHHPTVPNLGDLTSTDWADIEPVDIVCGGYPCQPFSTAGKRKGTADERHIWPCIANALGVLRPRIAIFENVAGHLRLGFDTVLADLARLGFDVEWACVRASEVGAPHQRNRLFILAVAADAPHLGHERGGSARRRGAGPTNHGLATTDARRAGLEVRGIEPHWNERATSERGGRQPAPDTARLGRSEGRPEPARFEGRPGAAGGSGAAPAHAHGGGLARDPERDGRPQDGQPEREPGLDADGRDVLGAADWGRFAPAIRRWEAATGRRAPWATDDRNRLSPRFVEWLMGLPTGHVTAVPDLTRTQQLHALGNGVVPRQAEAAIRILVERYQPAATAA